MNSFQRLSISDRLKSLGVKTGATDLAPPKPKSAYGIDSVVAGAYHPTQRGDVFIVEQIYTPDYRHGIAPILCSSPRSLISQWSNDPRLAEIPLSRFAFLDTETSGLAGGTGTYAFMVGIARFVDDQFVLRQFFMRDPAEESAMLEAIAQFLAPAQALVTFNGKAFDAPLLATRYRLHHIPIPHEGYAHLDLLPLARRLWRDRLESRALKYLEQHILGITRSSEEVPGYEIPWLYFDYLKSGDARPLAGVFYHNAMDVVTMAALLAHVNDVMQNPYDGRVEHGLDFIALGKLFEDLGHWAEAARLFEHGLQFGVTESDFGLAVRRLSILQKKRGDFEQALRLWEDAAANGHIYAHIEIAKYYEHKCHDVKTALKWTRSALDHVEHADLPAYMRKHWLDEINHRLVRLERKDNRQSRA
ncbi:MAG TPA: ribonuclease H-like domain-containing protein [Anaerolineales bacterium]|nr:ribonuclease H-like domain-containing protein [Anaerolineales bacterium]